MRTILLLVLTLSLAATMARAQTPFGGYGGYIPPGRNLEPVLPANMAPKSRPC